MEDPDLKKEINYLILPTGKTRKVIRLMKDKLGGKIMTKFVVLKEKTYIYDDGKDKKIFMMIIVKIKKIKGPKKWAMKRKLKFVNYRNFLEAPQLDNKIEHLELNKINTYSIKKTMRNS